MTFASLIMPLLLHVTFEHVLCHVIDVADVYVPMKRQP